MYLTLQSRALLRHSDKITTSARTRGYLGLRSLHAPHLSFPSSTGQFTTSTRENMGLVNILPIRTTPASHVLGEPRFCRARDSLTSALCHVVTDYPVFTTILLGLGALSLGQFLVKTLGVLLQTFILPGTSVSTTRLVP